MTPVNNYLIQAQQAKQRFLTYDQEAIIAKLKLHYDETWLYIPMLHQPHRICRKTGDMERFTGETWVSANSHAEVMTLLDLLCDSRPDRWIRGKWKNMADFGLMFHQNLLEGHRDPWAEKFESSPEAFHRACRTLGGIPFPKGDIAYTIELFDNLPITVQLWFGEEEFPAQLRFLWDENALMYIKYETMYYAKELLLQRLSENML